MLKYFIYFKYKKSILCYSMLNKTKLFYLKMFSLEKNLKYQSKAFVL